MSARLSKWYKDNLKRKKVKDSDDQAEGKHKRETTALAVHVFKHNVLQT